MHALERRLAGKVAALQRNYDLLQAMGDKLPDGGVSLTRANDMLQREVEGLQGELREAQSGLQGAAASGGGLLEAAVQQSGVADMVEVAQAAAPQSNCAQQQEGVGTMHEVVVNLPQSDDQMQGEVESLQGELREAEGWLLQAATGGGGLLEAAVQQSGMFDMAAGMGGGETTRSL